MLIIILVLFMLNLKSLLSAITLVCTLCAVAEMPRDYYPDNLEGRSKEDLKTELHKLIKVHTRIEYGSKGTWVVFRESDIREDGTIWDMYSNTTRYFPYSGAHRDMNIEHSVPKSWWGEESSFIYDASFDLHHLVPADASANMSKGNRILGVVDESIDKPTLDNGVSKSGKARIGDVIHSVFEPHDDYKGDFAHPTVDQEDVDYLLEIVNNRYPSAEITIDDIESSWAGLRPLISSNGGSDYNGGNSKPIKDESFDKVISTIEQFQKGEVDRYTVEDVLKNIETGNSESEDNPSAISRGSALDIDEDGLITVAGGKLTDYRKMAIGAMKAVIEILEKNFNISYELIDSAKYPVSGGEINPQEVDEETEKFAQMGIEKGLSESEASYLANLYGSNAPKVFALIDEIEQIEGLTLADTVSLRYAIDEEMALTPADFLIRRTNHMLFMRDTLDGIIEPVIAEMARYYGWTDEAKAAHTVKLNTAIAESDLKKLKGDGNR